MAGRLAAALGAVALATALTATSALGFGAFKAADTHATGGVVYGMAIGDVNADGRADIVAGNDDGSDHVSVLLGRRGGAFRAEKKVKDPRGPEGIAIGRFDRDRRRDLAVADYADGNSASRVSIFHGRGDGTFKLINKLRTGPGAWLIERADLNHDGKLDLVTGNYDTDGTDAVSIYIGKGRGEFRRRVDYAGPAANVFGLALGRMNADRNPDVVLFSANCTLTIYRGRANGTLGNVHAIQPCADSLGYGVTLGAFDATSGLDVAIPLYGIDQVALNTGDGSGGFVSDPTTVSNAPDGPNGIAAADLNRDGDLDLAVGRGDASGFSTLFGLGDGSFVPGSSYDGSDNAEWVETARLNADKGADVVVGGDSGVDVFLNRKNSAVIP